MSFPSQFSHLIWDRLYTVLIPDIVTLDKAYLNKFGYHSTGNRELDKSLTQHFTTVKIPVNRILEYFENGVEIQIPSRDDMIEIHKNIELYLGEWREHIKYDINLSLSEHKDLILSLEKLSKTLYEKCKGVEVIDNLFLHKRIGLVSPLQQAEESRKPISKPDYEGISSLVKSKTKPKGRFG